MWSRSYAVNCKTISDSNSVYACTFEHGLDLVTAADGVVFIVAARAVDDDQLLDAFAFVIVTVLAAAVIVLEWTIMIL